MYVKYKVAYFSRLSMQWTAILLTFRHIPNPLVILERSEGPMHLACVTTLLASAQRVRDKRTRRISMAPKKLQ